MLCVGCGTSCLLNKAFLVWLWQEVSSLRREVTEGAFGRAGVGVSPLDLLLRLLDVLRCSAFY